AVVLGRVHAGVGQAAVVGAGDRVRALRVGEAAPWQLSADADAVAARIVDGARVGVVALRAGLRPRHAAIRVLVADAVVAHVARAGAVARIRPEARAGDAAVGDAADVDVVAGRVVGCGGIGAGARARVAGAGEVAGVAGDADDGVGADAGAGGAVVGAGAGV